MKLGSTDSRSMTSKGYKKAELQSTRRREAEDMVDMYIKRDIRGLLDLVIPDDEDAKNAAGALATSISVLVEKLLSRGNRQPSYRSRGSSSNSRGSRGAATRRGGSGSRSMMAGKQSVSKPNNDTTRIISDWVTEQQNAPSTKGKPVKASSRDSVAALNKSFDKFRQWVNSNNSTNESTLYEPISQFFCFVASCLKAVHTPLQSVCPKRLVVPFCKPNRKSADGDDSSRVDLYLNLPQFDDYTIGTLITNPPEEENEAPMLADTFAIVEVKSAIQGIGKAMPQLFQYTRGIYNEQYDRRFAWGMAVGGKKVQAVFFGPDYALASDTICVDDASGRAKLVKLLVDWSFCESHRLGYDPAILHNKRLRYYEINVGGEDGPITYYSKSAVISAERLFGRHTRCFIASTAKPGHGATIEPDIFIKYAWPEATEDASVDYRDEGRHLQKITKTIEAEPNLDGKCPKYQSGGRVMIDRRVGNEGIKAVEDTSRSILSDGICQQLDDDQDFVNGLRVHKVICMKGVGKPLKELENVFEVICVMADAMECHWEIYQRCKILHRDISTNNILFSGSGSNIKGMLIDFDHAICEDDKDAVHHFERTGTLPFMSVNNLEGGKLEHSLLDDWQSLIYILCWVGSLKWTLNSEEDDPKDVFCNQEQDLEDIDPFEERFRYADTIAKTASLQIEASGDADEHGKPAEVCEVLVKRAWAISSQENDKSRDEVSMLREINNTLKGNKDLESKYPTLLAGGAVKMADKSCKSFDDIADTSFTGLRNGTLVQLTFLIQKCMVIILVGQDMRRELQAGLISGGWTSVDLVKMYLSRIDQFRRYNAMIFVKDRDLLLAEAASLDKERAHWSHYSTDGRVAGKMLHGIPVIVKDNACTSDMPTTAGALALKDAESGFDAEIVGKLRSAGAIIIGKANLSELSLYLDTRLPSGWSCLGGQTLNANSGSAHSGGSSSGPACAAALGLASGTIGTETCRSIIDPSMQQSVVGFKPSGGVCSNSGIIPVATTFDTPGPICRSVDDVAAMLDIISEGETNFSDLAAFNIKGSRVGISLNYGSPLNTNDSAHVVYHVASFAFNNLRELGCVVHHHDVINDGILSAIPYKDHDTIKSLHDYLIDEYYFILSCEFKDGLGRMLSKFSHIPSGVKDLKSLIEFNEQHPESLNPLINGQDMLLNADKTGGLDDHKYQASLDKILRVSTGVIKHIFSSSAKQKNRPLSENNEDNEDNLDFLITTLSGPRWPLVYIFAIISRCPIITIPLGKHSESDIYSDHLRSTNRHGVGYSLILIGKPGDDHKLLCYAKQIEDMLKSNQ
ncbi:hypothetical protein LPJ74_006540 [Coemansia sp. RSA 1843]|nr:hypothetical protein LPJ74_006540 [Coemansia sp. RSA 1843]